MHHMLFMHVEPKIILPYFEPNALPKPLCCLLEKTRMAETKERI